MLLVASTALIFGAFAYLLLSDRHRREEIARGRALYATHCAFCHGANLEGQPNWQTPGPNGRLPAPPHDATGHTWHHSDRELFLMTKHGMSAIVPGHQSDMPAFVDILSDAQIRAVLASIKATWPERERNYQENRNRAR